MNASHKGRRAEWRARRLLEASGFTVTRAAGSKGVADLIAWDSVGLRLISVKSGQARASRAERAALSSCPAPAGTSKEVWTFRDRCAVPTIEQV